MAASPVVRATGRNAIQLSQAEKKARQLRCGGGRLQGDTFNLQMQCSEIHI